MTRLAAAHDRAQTGDQHAHDKGLAKIVVCTAVERIDNRTWRIACGQDQEWRRWRRFPQRFDQCKAVTVR